MKKYEIILHDSGVLSRTNDGFTFSELMGISAMIQHNLMSQTSVNPEIVVKKTVLIDEKKDMIIKLNHYIQTNFSHSLRFKASIQLVLNKIIAQVDNNNSMFSILTISDLKLLKSLDL